MSNTFVVNNTQNLSAPCRTVLGFRNALRVGYGSGGFDGSYPLSNALDDSYHTEFSVDMAIYPTSAPIEFGFSLVTNLNYFLICSKNAGDCGLSVLIQVFRASTGAYETVTNFGSMTNGKPVMVYFGDKYAGGYADAIYFKITLSYTSKPYIMSMMAGDAIVFPRTMSTGFQPSFASYLDDVEQFNADDGLNVTIGRRMAKGKQLKGSINFVKMTALKEFWDEYANHVLNSKTLCLLWNTKMPDECIYGVQVPGQLTKPTYRNANFSQVDFEVIGWS